MVANAGEVFHATATHEVVERLETNEESLAPSCSLRDANHLAEARSPEGAFAPGLLEASVAACAGLKADAMADVIERTVLEFEGGRPRDDMALLVLRVPPSA